jgi:putative peptidoglycan lipid II flippase
VSAPTAAPDPGAPEPPAAAPAAAAPARRPPAAAALVAAGIFLSRIAGLVRQRALAYYLGTGPAADAFAAAIRIPNFLQNLFGEGALSASFVPVYAGLLARGEEERARRVASAAGALLALVTATLVLLGMLATPALVDVIVGGFEGEKRALTIRLVRLLFPGVGLLVLAAWCLGVLNSHRRFFLSYAAPVIWNIAIIAALLGVGRLGVTPERIAFAAAWGAVAGSALQLALQLPAALRLLGGVRATLGLADEHVRTVLRNFAPATLSRGIVQVSAFVDARIASMLPGGAVAVVANAQMVYTLPVSLFGMSISVAELTAMSRDAGQAAGSEAAVAERLRTRLAAGLARIAFFVVPSAVAFVALGDVIAAALFQTGRYGRSDVEWTWAVLAGSAVGLLASTMGRLYASALFALRDTRTPLYFSIARITLQLLLAWVLALQLPVWLGIPTRWGGAGLTAASGIAGWVEFTLLRVALRRRIGAAPSVRRHNVLLWVAALVGASAAWGIRLLLPPLTPVWLAVLVLGTYGVAYLAATLVLRVPEARTLVDGVTRRLRRG